MPVVLRLLLAVVVMVTGATGLLVAGALAWVADPGHGLLAAVGTSAGPVLSPGPSPSAPSPSAPSPTAVAALSFALVQVGTPYRFGGEGGGGFDCSGLVQAAYGSAGVRLPRVAQAQYDAGPRLATGSALRPGDLVFFGASATAVDHVGMVVTTGEMVDAPHTGAVVRVEPIWSDGYVGATRPAP